MLQRSSSSGDRCRFGVVPAGRSVIDNLLYVHVPKTDETRARIQRYVELVGLKGFERMYPAHLSGGMQQRVGIARAFSVEPDLLLMDEPFSHLDAITARALREELQVIWEKTKKTVLFVTHDVLEAVQLSNRIIIVAYGGRNFADFDIDLPYPRLQSDPAVATMQAKILEVFEEMKRRRRDVDPRITELARAKARTPDEQLTNEPREGRCSDTPSFFSGATPPRRNRS
jgi:ABC-type nitrate/sulfonate/bicarbonate transport system ATPase subunit